MPSIRHFAPPIALALLLSCGGGGGSNSGNTGIPAPANLHTVVGPGPKDFTITWTAPSATIDGYNLEAQENGGAFQKLNSGLIPPSYTSASFTFLDSVPEDTTFTFRVNAARGSQTSPYSNTTTANSGLGTPGQPTGEYDWNQSGVAVSWVRNSTMSTGYRLERAPSDSYGYPTGAWTTLAVADVVSSSYLDTTATMGAYYTYRVTNTKGTVSSSPSQASGAIFIGLPAPGQPTATYDFAKAAMSLTWTKNTTFNDGVKIERIETTSYGAQTGSWVELTPTDPTGNTFLDTSAVTGTYYVYRVSNLRNGTASPASTPSVYAFAGLLAPSYLDAYWDSAKGGVYLRWYAYSTYDGFSLERVACDAYGQITGTWTAVATVPASATDYTDLSTQEVSYYRYRITGRRGQTTSPAATSYLVLTPLAAPTNLLVTATTGGAQLTWQNHSNSATQIMVRRGAATNTYSYTDVAVLSSGDTSYVDPLAHLGNYSYSVVAKAGSSEAASAAVTFTTPNPLDALALSSTTRGFPEAVDAALTPSGTWGLATSSPFGMLSNNDPWTPYFPNNSQRSAVNMVRFDALGHPHLVYVVLNPQNNQEAILRHVWHDGTIWNNEDMGRTQLLYSYGGGGYDFRLDSAGVPHAILDLGPSGGYSSTMAYLHKVNGSWVQESLAGINPSLYLSAIRLRLDAADVPHVMLISYSTVYEAARSAEGTWSASAIATAANYTTGFVDGFWEDGDNAIVLYSVSTPYPSYGSDIMAIKKVAGTWQLPTILEHLDTTSPNIQAAQSPDRARIAMIWGDSFGFKALHLDNAGWHPTLLPSPATAYSYTWMYRVGFDSSNKIHILFKNPYPAVGYLDLSE